MRGSTFKVQRGTFGAVQGSTFKIRGWAVETLNLER